MEIKCSVQNKNLQSYDHTEIESRVQQMKEIKVQTFASLIQYRRNDSNKVSITRRENIMNAIGVIYIMGELERQMNVGSLVFHCSCLMDILKISRKIYMAPNKAGTN